MSKTINALLAAQKGMILNSPERKMKPDVGGYVADNNESKTKFGLIGVLVLSLIFAIVLTVNIKLFLAFRNSGARIEETFRKIESIETGIAKLDSKIVLTNSKIEQNSDSISSLTETSRAQKNLISDLNKTNDALTRRLSAVETQLGQLKNTSEAK